MITIDITLPIQIINFLISMFIINFFIIGPIRRNISKRRSIIKSFDESAQSFNTNASGRIEKYEKRMAKTREQINTFRESAYLSALEDAQATEEKGHQQAEIVHEEANLRIKGEIAQAEQELLANIPTYSKLALEKILN